MAEEVRPSAALPWRLLCHLRIQNLPQETTQDRTPDHPTDRVHRPPRRPLAPVWVEEPAWPQVKAVVEALASQLGVAVEVQVSPRVAEVEAVAEQALQPAAEVEVAAAAQLVALQRQN